MLDGGTPLIDDFGQYIHADWPGKVRSLDALKREWQTEQRMLVREGADPACRYGGFAPDRRKATGFFRVEKISDRWWFVDPEGCRFYSAGVNGAGAEPPRTQIVGRDKLFASIPTAAQVRRAERRAGSAARSGVVLRGQPQQAFRPRLADAERATHRRAACAPGA